MVAAQAPCRVVGEPSASLNSGLQRVGRTLLDGYFRFGRLLEASTEFDTHHWLSTSTRSGLISGLSFGKWLLTPHGARKMIRPLVALSTVLHRLDVISILPMVLWAPTMDCSSRSSGVFTGCFSRLKLGRIFSPSECTPDRISTYHGPGNNNPVLDEDRKPPSPGLVCDRPVTDRVLIILQIHADITTNLVPN